MEPAVLEPSLGELLSLKMEVPRLASWSAKASLLDMREWGPQAQCGQLSLCSKNKELFSVVPVSFCSQYYRLLKDCEWRCAWIKGLQCKVGCTPSHTAFRASYLRWPDLVTANS